jgi:hypothetical protein
MNMSCRDQQYARVSSKNCGKRVGVSEPRGICVRNSSVERRMMQKRGAPPMSVSGTSCTVIYRIGK